ncbi:MAG: ATP synthase F0 subunit B [Bdellovibrionales bacterium]|nr:ATP synthase F0 subunit B [Bdellovibrionales bacterium]NQZ17800.1 ATP synthase F0 subunit B [Bdellovibrionales bacterium]
MSQVLDILTSLGIDGTFFYQFVIFFIAFTFMNFIAFKPYLKAYDERVRRTVGGQQEAKDLLEQADKAEAVYKEEARKLNAEIRDIFAEANGRAKNEVTEIISAAQADAEQQVVDGRKALIQSVDEARKAMETHIPEISEKIQNKFTRQ